MLKENLRRKKIQCKMWQLTWNQIYCQGQKQMNKFCFKWDMIFKNVINQIVKDQTNIRSSRSQMDMIIIIIMTIFYLFVWKIFIHLIIMFGIH
jgi:hypothetical protein